MVNGKVSLDQAGALHGSASAVIFLTRGAFSGRAPGQGGNEGCERWDKRRGENGRRRARKTRVSKESSEEGQRLGSSKTGGHAGPSQVVTGQEWQKKKKVFDTLVAF